MKVSGNQSGTSSSFWINRRWVFHLRICLAIEKKFGPNVVLHCWRHCDLEYLGFLFFLSLKYLCLQDGYLWGILEENFFENYQCLKYGEIFWYFWVFYSIFSVNFLICPTSRGHARCKIYPKFWFFFFKRKMLFGNLITICRQKWYFSTWLKNRGFRFCEI